MAGFSTVFLNDESYGSDEPSVENGIYTLGHFNSRDISSYLDECGYSRHDQFVIRGTLDASITHYSDGHIKHSPRRGEFLSMATDSGLEFRLYTTGQHSEERSGYHIAILNHNQDPDNRVIEDDPTIFEVLMLRDNGRVPTPEEVFLAIMYTRRDANSQPTEYKSPAEWTDKRAVTRFQYLLTQYQATFRNYGRNTLYDQDYYVFMRMIQKESRIPQKGKVPSILEHLASLRLYGDPYSQGRSAH